MSGAGYLNLDLESLQLSFAEDPAAGEAELIVRADISILDATNQFFWSEGEASSSSAELKPFRQPVPEPVAEPEVDVAAEDAPVPEGDAEPVEPIVPNTVYTLGFNGFSRRTQFVDLNDDIVSKLANSSININIVQIVAEGEEPISLAKYNIPISKVLMINGCQYTESIQLNGNSIIENESSLTYSIMGDNNLSEFSIGCAMLSFGNGVLLSPPATWGLQYDDVIDPKAKEGPDPNVLRSQYLEAIPSLIEKQDTLVSYSITIGNASVVLEATEGTSEGEEATAQEQVPQPEPEQIIPQMILNGKISWNSDIASAIDIDTDIRSRPDLWTLNFNNNNNNSIFLSRNKKRNLYNQLTGAGISAGMGNSLSIVIKRVPIQDGVESGEPMVSKGIVDITGLSEPGASFITLNVNLSGEGFVAVEPEAPTVDADANANAAAEEKEANNPENEVKKEQEYKPILPSFTIDLSVTSPLFGGNINNKININNYSSVSTMGLSKANSNSNSNQVKINENRDVLKDLKNEISMAIRAIATEYLALYPAETDKGHSTGFEDRKIEFLHYLSSNGTYHSLKESLKPKIQRVVRKKYGCRGNATSSSGAGATGEIEVNDNLLSELYVYLVQQCNHVLNSIYTNTVIDKDNDDINKNAVIVSNTPNSSGNLKNNIGGGEGNRNGSGIDDEKETNEQLLNRLLSQANDCEADKRYIDAEQKHLERLQLINNKNNIDILLIKNKKIIFDVYYTIGIYYLRESARHRCEANMNKTVLNSNADSYENSITLATYNSDKARECIQFAVNDQPEEWEASQLLACILHENGQIEESNKILQTCITVQLGMNHNNNHNNNNNNNNNGILSDFAGYESDQLISSTISPLTYTILAVHYSCNNQKLKARKALRLAVKSYDADPASASALGGQGPKRTYVLLLCLTTIYLCKYGFINMIKESYLLTCICDENATNIATSRNELNITLPHIRHIYKLSTSEMLLICGDNESNSNSSNVGAEAINQAEASILCSNDPIDQINGYLTIAKICSYLSVYDSSHNYNYNEQTCTNIYNAITIAIDNKLTHNIPISNYILCCKLLLNNNKYQDALNICYTGLQLNSNSSSNSSSNNNNIPGCSLNLLSGICFLRQDRITESEISLREANILDNRNCEVWAYQALICLNNSSSNGTNINNGGYSRLLEAEASLNQSLRLGLISTPILRELSTAFISIDKLSLAEDLIRRVISCEGNKGSPMTRKILADILAGQSHAAQACEEYYIVIDNDYSSNELKYDSAKKCYSLLVTLGRKEEASSVDNIIKKLHNEISKPNLSNTTSVGSSVY
jgi:hypothetical protein